MKKMRDYARNIRSLRFSLHSVSERSLNKPLEIIVLLVIIITNIDWQDV